ncbi:MAG: hypothetical protein WCW68_14165 [Methanothrix sp.]
MRIPEILDKGRQGRMSEKAARFMLQIVHGADTCRTPMNPVYASSMSARPALPALGVTL